MPGLANVKPASAATVNTQAVIQIDNFSRASVRSAYLDTLLPALNVPIGWNGNTAGCVPGSPSAAAQDATLTAVNWFRSIAGLSPVTFDPALSSKAQATALMMEANNSLSHTPPLNWRCWTQAGSDGAGASNLALWVSGANAIKGYMEDPGPGNTAVGHRRWILYPPRTVMGSGSTGIANALYVFGPTGARPAEPKLIPWPTAGYFPAPLEPSGRWSISFNSFDYESPIFSNATVRVTLDGQEIPVTIQPQENGYGDPTLVWQLTAPVVSGGPDKTLHVQISNLNAPGVPSTYEYDVTLFDPNVDPPSPPTAPAAPDSIVASPRDGSVAVSWDAPSDGGSPITGYTVTSSPEGQQCVTTGATGCVVTGLTNGQQYTFSVTATNAVGTSDQSVPSEPVTPDSGIPVNVGGFHPMVPARVIDSRSSSQVGPYFTPWGNGSVRDVTLAGVAGVPVDAAAVVLNVTGVNATMNTYLTVWPKGQSRPTASNLNLPPGDTRPNLVMAKLGTDGKVSIYNNFGRTDVVIDVVGWYGPGSSASFFNELSPARIWDSRSGPGPIGKLTTLQTKNITVSGVGGVPANATAVVMNVTVVNPTADTYLTAWPTGQSRPMASNLNVPRGEIRPNLVVAKIGANGKVSFFNHVGFSDVVVDVVGYFAESGHQFSGMDPIRVWDTRPAPENVGPLGRVGQGKFKSIVVAGVNGVPSDAKAVVVNLTGVSPSASTHLTAWPTGEAMPVASNLNLTPGSVVPNLAVVKVGANGKISIFNNAGTTHVVVDVVGWFNTPTA